MRAHLSYLLITVLAIESEEFCLSNMENLRTVNILTADHKYSLLNRDNFNAINSDASF